jgi:hypothetical protein
VTIDRVWIGNWIYQIVTTGNCSAVASSHTLQFPTAHSCIFSVFYVFTSRLVTASNTVDPSTSVFTAHALTGFQLPSSPLHSIAIASLHTLQFTTAHSYVFSVCCVFTSHLVTASNSVDPTISMLTASCPHWLPTAKLSTPLHSIAIASLHTLQFTTAHPHGFSVCCRLITASNTVDPSGSVFIASYLHWLPTAELCTPAVV